MYDWLATTDCPPLRDTEIHVWRFSLDVGGGYQLMMSLLAPDEVRRAERFLFDAHREHFIVGRATSRRILGMYVGMPADDIEYAYDNLGKPRFRDRRLNAEFRFNFSNSHDRGLLAITRGCEVGVDLERVRSLSDMTGLAQRYFADHETQQMLALPESQRADAFFRLWTRKEAYLKAVGKGLAFPLSGVQVTLDDDAACRICQIDEDDQEAQQWSLIHLSPADGYHGALAIKRPANKVVLLEMKA